MHSLPIIFSRRINKILCLACLSMLGICIVLAAVFAFLRDDSLEYTILMLAQITAGFSLLYGILWAVFAYREKRKNSRLNEAVKQFCVENHEQDFSEVWDTFEFKLPRQELLDLAKKRRNQVAGGLLIGAAVVFAIVYVPTTIAGGFDGIGRLLGTLAFGGIIVIPGYVMQWRMYRKYAIALPSRIILSYGRLMIDEQMYPTSKIREILVSSPEIHNVNSPQIYRTLCVRTDAETRTYNLDYRSPGTGRWKNPYWNGYDEFCERLIEWGKNNRVDVKVNFMD